MTKKTETLYVITVHSERYQNNLFYDEVRRGINIEANLKGVNVEFLFGFQHDSGQFSDALGIIFAPDGSADCVRLIRDIRERFKVPVVQIDNQVYDETLAPPYDAFLGTDNAHGGRVTAEYLMSFLPEGGSILVLSGSEEFSFLSYHDRLKGMKSIEHFDITDILYGEFDLLRTRKILEEYFDAHAELPRAILAFNDDAAITARKILDARGTGQEVYVTGFDGSAAGRVALSRGDILCSYDQNPEYLGAEAVRASLSLSKGEAVSSRRLIQGPLLTSDNIGCTFYPGVSNYLDRTLTPLSFRKRRYELMSADNRSKLLARFRNELICPVIFGPISSLAGWLRDIDADKFIVVTDNNEFLQSERHRLSELLRSEGLMVESVGFPGGEEHKRPETLLSLTHEILEKKITKKSCLVLVGGGITGNVGGFAASILYRGIRFVHVPTTVMHMVDSSTGGKQAVDTTFGKNSLGNFFEPEFIFIDEHYLDSLSERELRSGLAECVKHALCQDVSFCDYIGDFADELIKNRTDEVWKKTVRETIRLKALLMESDSYEVNEGMALVYGHTLGNAVESASDYSLSHGEAVSIGMVAAAEISERLGFAEPGLRETHENVLLSVGLPIRIPSTLSEERMMEFLTYDKKYSSSPLSFVLLRKVGSLVVRDGRVPQEVPEEIIREVIRDLIE